VGLLEEGEDAAVGFFGHFGADEEVQDCFPLAGCVGVEEGDVDVVFIL
jgi:hypothetical protein